MSKLMQLAVTVKPHYPNGLEGTCPKLSRHIERLDLDLPKRSPSFYELAGQLDQLLYRFEGTQLRTVLLRHEDTLRKLHKSVQENIANWNLAQADRLLYSLEDAFAEIESDLD